RRDVFHHPLERRLPFEHADRPAGIARQQSRTRAGIDLDALMAWGMAGGRDHPDAGHDLTLAVEELDVGAGEVEPLRGRIRVAVSALVLQSLYVKRGLRKHGVLPAVVEVEVRVDHPADVRGIDIVLTQRLCHRGVDWAVI